MGAAQASCRAVPFLAAMRSAAGGCGTLDEAVAKARGQLHNGEALAAFRRMAVAQGADPASIDDLANSPHGPERTSGSNGGRVVIMQGVYGSSSARPAPAMKLAAGATPTAPHPPFWGAPVHGLEGCRSLDAFFTRAKAAADTDGEGDSTQASAKRSATTALERSALGPHGATVASVTGLDALQVGQACVAIGGGRQKLGEALTMGAGVLLHRKVGDSLREGDILFTLFAEVGGDAGTSRRVITDDDIDVACARVISAYTFGPPAKRREEAKLLRAFIARDGTVTRL